MEERDRKREERGQLEHRGKRNLMAAADDLMRTKGLDQATDVILGGSSAGGMIYRFFLFSSVSPLFPYLSPSSPSSPLSYVHFKGLATYIHVDYWASVIPANATVRGLADAGWFLDTTSIYGTHFLSLSSIFSHLFISPFCFLFFWFDLIWFDLIWFDLSDLILFNLIWFDLIDSILSLFVYLLMKFTKQIGYSTYTPKMHFAYTVWNSSSAVNEDCLAYPFPLFLSILSSPPQFIHSFSPTAPLLSLWSCLWRWEIIIPRREMGGGASWPSTHTLSSKHLSSWSTPSTIGMALCSPPSSLLSPPPLRL